MTQSVGQIGLDLVINKKGYDKQLAGITSMAKKAGATLAAAFTVKKIVDFGKQCIELGSDLSEVQNVVDVTFPDMTAQVDNFAKSAAASFGLSETMAKKFTGTFGSMAKAFGFSEKQAYDMGSTLTGLAGDVASFYNISQDEAYTKLKSVFTGETESLKDLGVVMTQSALDAYAMANGFGKTTNAMSEAEKVALRYAFVQNQLNAASGDFARTSDSWANQVRILKLQFDSLKATVGQGLINVFLPVIKVINTVIGKLMTLANAFKAFTELLTGKKSAGSQAVDAGATAEDSLSSAAGAADNLANATTGAGKAAKKAAKDMKSLMGFDKINKLNDADSSSGESTDGSGSGISGTAMDFGGLAEGETVIDKTNTSLEKLVEKAKELAERFKTGFLISFGDSEKNIATIKTSLESIGKTIKNIFMSEEVLGAADTWAGQVAESLGKASGSVAAVGIAIVTNLTSGISKSLEENKGYITEKIASIFRINGNTWTVAGDFAGALGEIISRALTSDAAISITSDICSILTTGVLGGAELFAKAGLDLTSFIAQPFIDNKGKIEEAITNTLKPVSDVVNTVKTAVQDAFTIAEKTYDQHIAPLLDTLKQGFSDTFGKLLDAYNIYVAPVLSNLSTKFKEVYEQHLKPCLDKIGDLIGTVADAVKELYLTWFKPFVDWCIETIIPILAPVFETLGEGILDIFGAIGDIVGGVIDVFSGVITFLTGVFTGNWDKAWQGIKDIFSGIVDIIKGIWSGIKTFFSTIWEAIKKVFSPVVTWFKEKFKAAYTKVKETFQNIGTWFGNRWTSIKNKFTNAPTWFKEKFKAAYTKVKETFQNIGTWFGNRWTSIKNKFTNAPTWFKEKFKAAYGKIKEVFSNIGSWFGDRWTSIKNKFMNAPTWFKEKFKAAYGKIKEVFSNIGSWFGDRWTSIKNKFMNAPTWFKEKFSGAWTKIKEAFSGVGTFFGGIWNTIKGTFEGIGTKIGDAIGGTFKNVINSVLATVESTVNKGIGFINGAIGTINKIPGVNMSKMNTVSLPRLAQGGYVKPNTPQLAMIGDNRHQGEVVAPEDKLKEMAMQAVRAAGGESHDAEILKILREILLVLKELDLNIVIDGRKLKDIIVEKINQNTRATGVCEILV